MAYTTLDIDEFDLVTQFIVDIQAIGEQAALNGDYGKALQSIKEIVFWQSHLDEFQIKITECEGSPNCHNDAVAQTGYGKLCEYCYQDYSDEGFLG